MFFTNKKQKEISTHIVNLALTTIDIEDRIEEIFFKLEKRIKSLEERLADLE